MKLSSATNPGASLGKWLSFRNLHAGSESFMHTEHLIPAVVPCSGDDSYFHFNNDETEHQRGQVRCPQSYSQEGVQQGI